MEPTSLTRYSILSQLCRKEMSGYELIAYIEKITGKKPSTSQIYPVLRQMKSGGYLSVATVKEGRKVVKYYKITKSGKHLFKAVSKRFESIMLSALKEKIKGCAHCGCEIFKGAYRKGGAYFCCSSCASSV